MNAKKLCSLVLCVLILLAVCAGCAGAGNPGPAQPTQDPTERPGIAGTPSPTPSPTPPAADSYTLNESLSYSPQNWNIHSWETYADQYVWLYTEMPLVDVGYVCDEAGRESFTWLYEMATGVEDVTVTWEGGAAWGIDPSQTGRVWRIHLNPAACWDDEAKTPITADTYLYAMRQCLDPQMKNHRASRYIQGDAAILGAKDYYQSGSTSWAENTDDAGTVTYALADWVKGADGQYQSSDGIPLYFMLTVPITYWTGGYSLAEYYEFGYVHEDTYTGLSALANDEGYVPVTDESIALLYAFTGSEDWGRESQEDLANYVAYEKSYPVAGWDTVGLLKEDDYTLLYLCENEISQFYFYTSLATNWLVYEPLYEAGKTEENGLVTTDYGTSADRYMSYGPYRLVSCQNGTRFVFQRNDSWYGYHDGKHQGQYQTTGIVTDIIPDHEEALSRFESGQLDHVELIGDDMNRYRYADNLLKTDESYTYRYFMVTDRDALTALQEAASVDGQKVNKLCLAYKDFRQAMAYSLDRADFALKGTYGGKPALGLLNDLYYYDIEHASDSIYRSADQAKAGICQAYGVTYGQEGQYATLQEAYEACTGHNVDLARSLFQAAYTAMLEAGDWTDDMVIQLNCAVAPDVLTDQLRIQNSLLQGYFDEAMAGTGFAGKLTITYTVHPDRYDGVMNGEVEMGMGAWGSAAFYPYNMMQCYCDPSYTDIQELCGFDPTTETLTIQVAGANVTKTYQDWSRAIILGGEYALLDPQQRVGLLAAIETALIQQWNFIVVYSSTQVSIHTDQIRYVTDHYNVMYGFGGIRYLCYNYTDAEWDAQLALAEIETANPAP